MNYQETVQYLYDSAPLFQNIGAGAYKEGLANTIALDEHFSHPHRMYKTIHVAGTNGKGSCSHTIAAIFQAAGYRVGLYTSPHLKSFRERIRINGEMISEEYVVEFVEKERSFFEPLHPSFFEITTAMAFKYFADELVDIAIIEVGMGGRLDCTNIITPVLSVITNISLDHTGFLGSTLDAIAREKAGIMKPGVTTVIGEVIPETRGVFTERAQEVGCPLVLASESPLVIGSEELYKDNIPAGREYSLQRGILSTTSLYGELSGDYQEKNVNTLLHVIRQLIYQGEMFQEEHIRQGFAQVCSLTGLRGRWEVLGSNPLMICDTGHNIGGWQFNARQLMKPGAGKLRMVFGMAGDKDISGVISLLPKDAEYYLTQATVKRALDAESLGQIARNAGLLARTFSTVAGAIETAIKESGPDDVIFIGGSNFVVADCLDYLESGK